MVEVIRSRYKIIRSIGTGGMSEVFLAHDDLLGRDVAIKRLKDQFVDDKNLLEQFGREARSAASLVHPNIIAVYDVIDDGQDQYIVMEYVDGHTLKELLQDYRIDPKSAVKIVMQVADGLQHAHDHNVVHCDIKPQNILVNNDMVPKIADFGIAKMVTGQTLVFSGDVMGSVYYVSPEQAAGRKVTAASDIYSLGIVLYEMLTGDVPFRAETAVAVAMMQVEKEVPPLSETMTEVPPLLQEIMNKCLAKKPEDRYASARELCNDLEILQWGDMESVAGAEGNAEKESSDKIIELNVNRAVMAKKAKGWKANLANHFRNHRFTFNQYVIMLTAVVCLISLLAHFILERKNAFKPIPDVVEMKVEEARDYLVKREYKVELEEENTSEDKAGIVIRQIPAAGEKRRGGSKIRLVFSVGAQRHTLPNLVDMTLVKAQQTLDELKIRIGKVERKYSRSYRIGAIISQVPKAGEKVPEGSLVDLIVNEGTKLLPDLTGLDLSEAEKTIRALGLRVGEVRRVNSPEPKNSVTATFPESGIMLPGYYPVHLTVSDGTDQSVVGAMFEYKVPGNADEKHRLQVYKIDRKGRNLVFSGERNGGHVIRLSVDKNNGKVTMVVYCDGKQAEESAF